MFLKKRNRKKILTAMPLALTIALTSALSVTAVCSPSAYAASPTITLGESSAKQESQPFIPGPGTGPVTANQAKADISDTADTAAHTGASETATQATTETIAQPDAETTTLPVANTRTPQRRLVPDATSNNYAGKKAEPIFRVRTDKPWVSLSFDAGADRGQAGAIMDILEKYNISSTFFLTADWMRQNPENAKSIVERGHEIGNHSVNHPSFPKLSEEKMAVQIQETHQVAKDLTGVDMCLFRFPYGDYNNTSVDTVKNCGYYGIQWSVDSIDWRNEGRQIIIDRVLNHKNLGNGSIILMHMAATYTPSALEEIIQGIQAKGYEIVPVSHLIYETNYHMDYAGTQIPDSSQD